MREKYVEERFQRYRIFGEHPSGKVDIASGDDLTICTVSREEAEKLISQRDDSLNMLVELALKLSDIAPDEFDKIWGYK